LELKNSLIVNDDQENLEQELDYDFDGYADGGFHEGPQYVKDDNSVEVLEFDDSGNRND
jgi:hypothetical protein